MAFSIDASPLTMRARVEDDEERDVFEQAHDEDASPEPGRDERRAAPDEQEGVEHHGHEPVPTQDDGAGRKDGDYLEEKRAAPENLPAEACVLSLDPRIQAEGRTAMRILETAQIVRHASAQAIFRPNRADVLSHA